MTIRELFELNRTEGDIGIEIEMEGSRLTPERGINYWDMKPDGSLRGNSVEYVLISPCPRKDVQQRLETLRSTLTKAGARLVPSDRCGVHIHVNCQELTQQQTFNFITLYLMFENVLLRWCGESREGNLFCLRSQDAESLLVSLISAKSQGNIARVNGNNFRYASCNVTALGRYGSLEFRSMQTPEDFSSIVTWVDLLTRILDKSLEVKRSEDMIEALSLDGPETFARRVLGEKLLQQVMCRDFDTLMIEGMRSAQCLAYTPFPKTMENIEQAAVPMPGRPVRHRGAERWQLYQAIPDESFDFAQVEEEE